MESIWLESPVALEELIHVKKQALNNIDEDKNAHHATPLKFVKGLPFSILKPIGHVGQLQGSLSIMYEFYCSSFRMYFIVSHLVELKNISKKYFRGIHGVSFSREPCLF